jgi:DNA polymerase elongation subunit (family B)
MDLRQGFVLTRHWRDTPSGIEVEFWLATDDGPQLVRLPYQTSTAFIPSIQSGQAQALLQGERGWNFVSWRCVISSHAR